jgi:hypothetical protein
MMIKLQMMIKLPAALLALPQDDLSHLLARLQMVMSRYRVSESEDPVDDRFDPFF